jgi:hypothetical protein
MMSITARQAKSNLAAYHDHQRPLCPLHRLVAEPLLAGCRASRAVRVAGGEVREGPAVARLLRAWEKADEEGEAAALAWEEAKGKQTVRHVFDEVKKRQRRLTLLCAELQGDQ